MINNENNSLTSTMVIITESTTCTTSIRIILSYCMGGSKEKQDYMVVKARVITKLLPSRQIVHSTKQVVYLAHANMHTNHLLGSHFCKQVL